MKWRISIYSHSFDFSQGHKRRDYSKAHNNYRGNCHPTRINEWQRHCLEAGMENSSPGFRALSHSKHKTSRAAQDTPGHPYGAGIQDPEPTECLYSCGVTEPWVKVTIYQLPVFGKASWKSPDLPNAAIHIQASSLQLPVPQARRDSAHLIMMQALRTGQMIPTPGLSPQPSTFSSKTRFDRLFRQQQSNKCTHCQIIWSQIKDFINPRILSSVRPLEKALLCFSLLSCSWAQANYKTALVP